MITDFDKYKVPESIGYPDQWAYRSKLLEEINNTPMTAKERDQATMAVPGKAHAWFLEAVKPYTKAEQVVHTAFINDCRQELGYGGWLHPKGCAAMEQLAWDMGHSSGYSEVYNMLLSLVPLAEAVRDNLILPTYET